MIYVWNRIDRVVHSSVQYLVCSGQYTVDSAHYTVNTVQSTSHPVQCTVHSVQCTVYQCTVHSAQCTVYSALMMHGKLLWKTSWTPPLWTLVVDSSRLLCHLALIPNKQLLSSANMATTSIPVSRWRFPSLWKINTSNWQRYTKQSKILIDIFPHRHFLCPN